MVERDKNPDIHSPWAWIDTSPDAERVGNIVEWLWFSEINTELQEKGPGRQKRILQSSWYVEDSLSRIKGFKHYVNKSTGWFALYVERLHTFISFDWDIVTQGIHANLIPNKWIACDGFIVKKEGKYYFYTLGNNFTQNWTVTCIIFDGVNNWLDSSKELSENLSRAKTDSVLKEKSPDEQKEILSKLWFQPIQKSRIEALVHYWRRKEDLEFEYVLFDTQHDNLLHFDNRFVHDEISILTGGSWKFVGGITLQRWNKHFFYILWKQYADTKKPMLQVNSNSPDGSFGTDFELKAYIEWYWSWWKPWGSKN
jgi:hypothetical protein